MMRVLALFRLEKVHRKRVFRTSLNAIRSTPRLDVELADIPLIDLEGLSAPSQRSIIVEDIGKACREYGFFQVINHGISQSILDGALSVASAFFDLLMEEKTKLMSNDVQKPIRYATSLKDSVDKVQYWRIFLKHYANPLHDWIEMWPNNPPDYRKKMGEFTVLAQELAIEIAGTITQSLGLDQHYLTSQLNEGMQVMAVNCYPMCPEPQLALGLPPHTDYTCLTILLQDSSGLQILDPKDKQWKMVPMIPSALQIHVGDHLEVLSNGRYKRVVHKVTLNSEKARISIASLHSLGMDVKMEAAKELVDEEHPNGYIGKSFQDFLDFIEKNDLGQGKSFLETLKIQP